MVEIMPFCGFHAFITLADELHMDLKEERLVEYRFGFSLFNTCRANDAECLYPTFVDNLEKYEGKKKTFLCNQYSFEKKMTHASVRIISGILHESSLYSTNDPPCSYIGRYLQLIFNYP